MVIRSLLVLFSGLMVVATAAAGDGPSYSCAKVEAGSIEALVCGDAALSALDRQLAAVYQAATAKAVNEQPPLLKAEQRGWLKGRDECWKSSDVASCVATEYRQRIASLQARYQLVAGRGPISFRCDPPAGGEVIATFYATEPASLVAERGDQVSLMLLQADGKSYLGRNETLAEVAGGVTVTWGYGEPPMNCSGNP